MAKINWRKARKFRDYEEKYDPGTELANGRVVAPRRPDSLAARAADAEAKWLAEMAAKAKKQRQRGRRAYRRPKDAPLTEAQAAQMQQIRAQLGYPDED